MNLTKLFFVTTFTLGICIGCSDRKESLKEERDRKEEKFNKDYKALKKQISDLTNVLRGMPVGYVGYVALPYPNIFSAIEILSKKAALSPIENRIYTNSSNIIDICNRILTCSNFLEKKNEWIVEIKDGKITTIKDYYNLILDDYNNHDKTFSKPISDSIKLSMESLEKAIKSKREYLDSKNTYNNEVNSHEINRPPEKASFIEKFIHFG